MMYDNYRVTRQNNLGETHPDEDGMRMVA